MAATSKEPTTSKRGRGNRSQQKKVAQTLYLETQKTQNQIAEQVGVTPQTLSKWVRQGNWDVLRAARQVTRPQLVRQYILQLHEINEQISERPEEERIPTAAEVDQMVKLSKMIRELDKDTSLMDYVHVMEQFLLFVVRAGQPQLVSDLEPLINEFILMRSDSLG